MLVLAALDISELSYLLESKSAQKGGEKVISRKLKIPVVVCLLVILVVLIQSHYTYGIFIDDTWYGAACDCNSDGKADCGCEWACSESCQRVDPPSSPSLFLCNDCRPFPELPDLDPPTESNIPEESLPTNGDESEDTTSPAPENPTVKFGDRTLALTPMLKTGTFQGHPETSLLVRKPGTEELTTVGDVLVDTGADITLLPLRVAKGLEYDLDSLDKVELGVVGGTNYGYGVASIEIGIVHMGGIEENLDGYLLGKDGEPLIWEVPVVFLPGEAAEDSILLGRLGVLNKITLIFASEDMVKIKVKED